MDTINIGVPIIPVITLKGISFGAKLLANISTITIIIDPISIDKGITFLLLLPIINLTTLGITSPIQPIVPLTATDIAVKVVAPPIVHFYLEINSRYSCVCTHIFLHGKTSKDHYLQITCFNYILPRPIYVRPVLCVKKSDNFLKILFHAF